MKRLEMKNYKMIKRADFICCFLEEVFEKQTKTIEDQRKLML